MGCSHLLVNVTFIKQSQLITLMITLRKLNTVLLGYNDHGGYNEQNITELLVPNKKLLH